MTFFKRHWPVLVILLCTVFVYAQTLQFTFVNLDDPNLVYENPIVIQPTLKDFAASFTHYDPELYIPLTFVSYQIESFIFGMDAWHFHLMNLLLHLIATTLVYFLIKRLSERPLVPIFVAALFALHPINTETVSWISARKDLLSSVFSLGALLAYIRPKLFWLSALLFLLALLSKVTAVMFVPLALLIDWWLGSFKKEKLKQWSVFVLLAVIFGVVAILGKTKVIEGTSPLTLLLLAPRSIVWYLQTIFWPIDLSVVHHYSGDVSLARIDILLSWLFLASSGIALWFFRRKWEEGFFGFFFFLLALAPSLTHAQHGGGFTFLASERYVYVAGIGIFFIIATLIDSFVRQNVLKNCLIIAMCGALSFLSFNRTKVFAESVVFNRDILVHAPSDHLAHYNLAIALEWQDEMKEAEAEYRKVIELRSDYINGHVNLGILLAKTGRLDEAEQGLKHAVEIRPGYYKAHYNLGVVQEKMGKLDDALLAYQTAKSIDPFNPDTYKDRARVLGQQKKYAEALNEYRQLVEVDPSFADILQNLQRP